MTHVRSRIPLAVLLAMLLALAAISPALATHFKIVEEEYYFAGAVDDQLNKVGGRLPAGDLDPAAPTFTQDAPGDGDPVFQTTSSLGRVQQLGGGVDGVGNPLSIYWVGAFTGEVGGIMDLEIFMAAPASAIHMSNFDVRVWADPDLAAGTGTLLGSVDNERREVRPGEPTPHRFEVAISGKVSERVLVQLIPRQNSSDGTIAAYGNADYPSGFTLPTRVPIDH